MKGLYNFEQLREKTKTKETNQTEKEGKTRMKVCGLNKKCVCYATRITLISRSRKMYLFLTPASATVS